MKKLDKLNKIKGYVIHCKTFTDAVMLCRHLHEHGYKWRDGCTYETYNYWNIHKENTCYNPYEGSFSRLEFYKSGRPDGYDYDYNVIDLETFLSIL